MIDERLQKLFNDLYFYGCLDNIVDGHVVAGPLSSLIKYCNPDIKIETDINLDKIIFHEEVVFDRPYAVTFEYSGARYCFFTKFDSHEGNEVIDGKLHRLKQSQKIVWEVEK